MGHAKIKFAFCVFCVLFLKLEGNEISMEFTVQALKNFNIHTVRCLLRGQGDGFSGISAAGYTGSTSHPLIRSKS